MIRSALITGITGQDGGYLAELLADRGASVHGVVRPGATAPAHLRALGPQVTLHEVALDDQGSLRRVLAAAAPDAVFNLVGMSSVALSWQQPVAAVAVNGGHAISLLETVWREQQRTGRAIAFVQASSAEIYAGVRSSPQNEDDPVSPQSPYGASKALAHHLVQIYRARGMHASNAVMYNHESPRRPTTFVTRKITSTAVALSRGRTEPLALGNLDVRRDWGWAPEYVEALLRMAERPTPGDYVLATGTAHSVAEFVETAFARVGIDDWRSHVRLDGAFTRRVESVELIGDASRARDVLGWVPQVCFVELVHRMVDHDLSLPAHEAGAGGA